MAYIKIAIIVLAAGSSSRLGQPKQLLPFNNTTLLQHTIQQAVSVPAGNVMVVTGANKDAVEKEIQKTPALYCHNEYWQDGMASTLQCGLQEILKIHPDTTACIITVCDQPFINTDILNKLIKKYNDSGYGIVASSYADTAGTPALFDKKHFPDLFNLKGHEGARKLFKTHSTDITQVPFEKGAVDIDTISDYNELLKNIND